MSSLILNCHTKICDGLIEVLSPSVGRLEILVAVDEHVVAHQVIARFTRLNTTFLLHIDDDVAGKIIRHKNDERVMSIAYGEPFLVIDPKVSSASVDKKAIETKNPSAHQVVNAPMDGMFYLSPSPKSPPFVNVGDEISPGQTIGLIEVMKCFYPITYKGSHKAKIVGINVKDATAVNYGSKLFLLG